jgi:hypothetical protein
MSSCSFFIFFTSELAPARLFQAQRRSETTVPLRTEKTGKSRDLADARLTKSFSSRGDAKATKGMRGKCKGSSLLNAALTVWLAAMFATARPHTDYSIAEGEQHNLQAYREQVIQHHEYLHAKSLVKGRMKESIEATKHQRSRWLAASVQCILRNETTDEEAQRVLSWLCDADGAGHSCHGIKEGGSHYHPVHPKDHLEWTMTSLHEMHEEKINHGHSTCWFGGIAYLVPPPVNELFLELPSGSDSIAPGATLLLRSEGDTIEGRLVRSGGENMSLCRDVQVLKAGESIAFEAKNYHAVADRMRKKATFEIHVRGDVIGAVLLAEVCAILAIL